MRVTDAAAAAPYHLGVALLAALRTRPHFAWSRDGAALTWLVGTDRLWADLEAGRTPEQILAADATDHAAWRVARRKVLLYR